RLGAPHGDRPRLHRRRRVRGPSADPRAGGVGPRRRAGPPGRRRGTARRNPRRAGRAVALAGPDLAARAPGLSRRRARLSARRGAVPLPLASQHSLAYDDAMRVDELILVSVDDHVVEPPDMFTEHLPASYQGRDDVPHVVRTDVGDDVWVYDGREFPNIGLNAVAGRPRDEYGMDPTSYDEMRPGCWDVDARIGDMNANGVLASLCFPSFPRLCGQVFAEAQDKD